MTAPASSHPTTRRRFLKLAATGTAAAMTRSVPASAAEKTITILHESSFIKPFDDYVMNTLAPAYEKEAGVRINYEVTSVGSLPTRISTIAETGSWSCENDFGSPKSPSDAPRIGQERRTEQFFPAGL